MESIPASSVGRTEMNNDMTGMYAAARMRIRTGGVPPRRLSRIFTDLARGATGPVSIADIRDAMGDRSFAALLVVFASFNLLPLPPGSTFFFALPLILVSSQMVLGYRTAWLPQSLLRKSVQPERFRKSVDRLVPMLRRLERLVKPRYWPFSRNGADRLIGAIALVLAIAVFLPIPLGNWLPAFSIATVALALSERDGILLAIGLVVGVISIVVVGFVLGAVSVVAAGMFGL